ncbi:MAG: alpha/beta fold hydrolase [Candidatus Sericytochromatia bacterium]
MFPSVRVLPLALLTALLLACQALPPAGLSKPSTLTTQSGQNASVSWLQFVEQDYQRVFDEHDRNRNGSIEAGEIPHATHSFAGADRNRDGRLSRAEALPDQASMARVANDIAQSLQDTAPAPRSEDPQLDPLPTPAHMGQLRQEMAQPAQRRLNSKVPVLLVPGYAEPSWYFMYGIYRNLKAQGWPVEGINLFPNFASAEEQALKVKARIDDMRQRLGVDRVDLVVHSFGGLISRHYIQELGGTETVRQLITVATPHHGTLTAHLGPGESAVQLRPNSAFLKRLNGKGFAYAPVRYTSIWSNLDEIVIPPKNAIMPDSTVHYVPWTGHLTIMFSQRTYRYIREALSTQ